MKAAGYEDPIIVSATDGVGTKLRIAQEMGRHATIGAWEPRCLIRARHQEDDEELASVRESRRQGASWQWRSFGLTTRGLPAPFEATLALF
jgi:hypothetical protein